MDVEALRNVMLTCAKDCRASIMLGRRECSLIWMVGSHWHQSFISKDKCIVDSKEFLEALEGAEIGLIY